MFMQSLLYVSRSVIPQQEAGVRVSELAAQAAESNAASKITGALIFSGEHFAQILEGDSTSLNQLMASISRDPRHVEATTLFRFEIAKRRFEGWDLAYAGTSRFVSGHITPLLSEKSVGATRTLVVKLVQLIEEFATFSR